MYVPCVRIRQHPNAHLDVVYCEGGPGAASPRAVVYTSRLPLSKGQAPVKTIGAVLLALVALAAVTLAQADSQTQQGLSIGVDADPSGNTATSLGTIDSCVSVKKGDKFQVDVFITGADNLLAWETYFSYDGSIVTVTDRDVKLFLAADPKSDVFDASESLPSSGGLYRLGAVDMGHSAPHSGSGVLTRLTLRAVGAGISPAILMTLDANNDGKTDLGTRLRDPQEKLLGDSNGDEFYDGLVYNAQIAVDRDCPSTPAQTATPSPGPFGADTSTATAVPTGSPAATAPSATPAATTPAPALASPTPDAVPSAKDEGVDWGSPGFIAAYAGVGTLALLAVSGLAFFTAQRRRH